MFINLIEACAYLNLVVLSVRCSNSSQHSSSGLLTGWTSICGYDSTRCTPVPSSLRCQESIVVEAEEQLATI